MAKKPKDESQPGRLKQLREVAKIVHRADPKALPLIALAALGALIVVLAVGFVVHALAFTAPLAILIALMVAMTLFGRRAKSVQFQMLDGQPGAPVAILENMRGDWTVERAVSGNRNMDLVHRAVGRPGVVLIGEGSPNRLGSLLAAEKRRIARVAYDVPIYDFQVGNGEGQVPLSQLERRVMKLPRNLKKGDVSELNYRLKALPAKMQAPKGPMPKNARPPKGFKPRAR